MNAIKTMDGIAVKIDRDGWIGNGKGSLLGGNLSRNYSRKANDAILPLVSTYADYGALVEAVTMLANKAPAWAWQDLADKSVVKLRRFLMSGDVGLCGVEREVTVDRYLMNAESGALRDSHTETVIRPCAHPFPGDGQVICKTCREGYSVNGNRPTSRGLAQIAAIKAWEALKP